MFDILVYILPEYREINHKVNGLLIMLYENILLEAHVKQL